jgi:hypothetical protein
MGRHKTIYLLLAIACFLGIVLIFIFDGYMGVYDSLVMDNGQFQQNIGADQWQQQERFGYNPSVSVDRGSNVNFTYTVENHRFSSYAADVSVSLYFGTDKIADLAEGRVTAAAFSNGRFTWTLDSNDFIPAGNPPEQSYNMVMVIDRENVERKVTVYIYPGSAIPKPALPTITIPPPPR